MLLHADSFVANHATKVSSKATVLHEGNSQISFQGYFQNPVLILRAPSALPAAAQSAALLMRVPILQRGTVISSTLRISSLYRVSQRCAPVRQRQRRQISAMAPAVEPQTVIDDLNTAYEKVSLDPSARGN